MNLTIKISDKVQRKVALRSRSEIESMREGLNNGNLSFYPFVSRYSRKQTV